MEFKLKETFMMENIRLILAQKDMKFNELDMGM